MERLLSPISSGSQAALRLLGAAAGYAYYTYVTFKSSGQAPCMTCFELVDEPHKIYQIYCGEAKRLKDGVYDYLHAMGTLSDIESRPFCPLCRSVRQVLSSDRRVRQRRGGVAFLILRLGPPEFMVYYKTQQEEPILTGFISLLTVYDPVRAQKSPTSLMMLDWPLYPKAPQIPGLNYSLVKEWIDQCLAKHGDMCHTPWWQVGGTLELNFIDVVDKRLVTGSSESQYFALSYVWGSHETFKTKQENLEILRQPGGIQMDLLPKTIRNAMELTARLGARYIWVDRLCIVQDSPNKKDLINSMNIVYAQAQLTIIALSGEHADEGLPGVADSPRPPIGPLEYFSTNYNDYVSFTARYLGLGAKLEDSVYTTRGWTYQERILSRRRLYLAEGQAYFHCSCAIYEEQHGLEDRSQVLYPGAMDDGGGSKLVSGWVDESGYLRYHDGRVLRALSEVHNPLISIQGQFPTLNNIPVMDEPRTWVIGINKYTQLVEQFTATNLTNPGDILDAFAGLASVLADRYGGTMISNLPENQLDVALLWVPASGNLTLRTLDKDGHRISPGLPTWSWAGWQGGSVRYCYREFGFRSNILLSGISSFWLEDVDGVLRRLERADIIPDAPQGLYVFVDLNCTFSHRGITGFNFILANLDRPVLHFHAQIMDTTMFEVKTDQSQLWPPKHPRATPAVNLGFLARFGQDRDYTFLRFGYQTQQGSCGTLINPAETLSWDKFDESYKLVLLSRWSRVGDSTTSNILDGFDKDEAVANIMLVKMTPGGFALRLAVGFMEWSAWTDDNSEWEYMRLL